MKKVLLLLVIIATTFSCTDTDMAQYASYGERHKIELYSGGVKVREWVSSGITSSNSAGYCLFKESGTHKLVCVKGDVVITVYNEQED